LRSRTVESIINRCYDPSTDQYLSIDPYVASTDQTYVFTNDDPLNAEAPLGEIPLGGAFGRGICIFALTANCLGRLAGDLSANASAAEQVAIGAIESGDAEDVELTAEKAAGEVKEATAEAGKEIEGTAKSTASGVAKVSTVVGKGTRDIISDLIPKGPAPVIKIGPIKIPLYDFDFGL
jgi:hypothetical protein